MGDCLRNRLSRWRGHRLVQIRPRQLECVADNFDPRLQLVLHDDLNHIKPKQDIGIVEQAKPGQRAARDSSLLIGPDGFNRSSEFFAAAGLHFDEHERVAIAADNVDLSAAAPVKIAIENLVTVSSQKPAGQLFAERAALDVIRFPGAREAAAPPARKSGDGSDRGPVHEAWSGAARCRNLCVDRSNTPESGRRSHASFGRG